MTEEIWQSIQGYEGLYWVSNLGRVKSKTDLLQPLKDRGKYLRVQLSKHNIQKFYSIHRLVALAFIPNPENKAEVNHIDGNKQNNTVQNLQWCSRSENMQHQFDNGLNVSQTGRSSRAYKGDVEVFNAKGELVEVLKGRADMVAKGYNPSNISEVLSGKRKTHKGFTFKRINKE